MIYDERWQPRLEIQWWPWRADSFFAFYYHFVYERARACMCDDVRSRAMRGAELSIHLIPQYSFNFCERSTFIHSVFYSVHRKLPLSIRTHTHTTDIFSFIIFIFVRFDFFFRPAFRSCAALLWSPACQLACIGSIRRATSIHNARRCTIWINFDIYTTHLYY